MRDSADLHDHTGSTDDPNFRVAIVSDAIAPWHQGGKETRWAALAAALVDRGLDVDIYTMRWWGSRRLEREGICYIGVCRPWSLYTKRGRRTLREAIGFAVGCTRLLRVRADVIDVDHMPYLHLPVLWVMTRLRRVPLLITWNEVWGVDGWRTYLGSVGPVAAAIERHAMRIGDHHVAISPETAGRLIAGGVRSEDLTMIDCGVDVASANRSEASWGEPDVVFAGRLNAHKNVDVLIDAIALLAGRGTRLRCVIIGDGPERVALERRASSSGVAAQIEFAGALSDHQDVLSAIGEAHVVALPSRREGFGIIVAEAIAAGTPVVTLDHPENAARLLVDAGVTGIVCGEGAERLAAGIGAAAELGPLSDDIRQAASEKWAWKAAAATLAETYRRVAADARESVRP